MSRLSPTNKTAPRQALSPDPVRDTADTLSCACHHAHDATTSVPPVSRHKRKNLREYRPRPSARQLLFWPDAPFNCYASECDPARKCRNGYRHWEDLVIHGPITCAMARDWRRRGCFVHLFNEQSELLARIYPDGRVDRRAWYDLPKIGVRW